MQVVDDLEGEAQVLRVGDDGGALRRLDARAAAAPTAAEAMKSAPVLRLWMNSRVGEVEGALGGRRGPSAWPGDHAVEADRPRQLRAPAPRASRRRARPASPRPGSRRRGSGARRRRGWPCLAVRDVAGGPPAPRRGVVHRRQVVEDQARGVHHLHGAGRGQHRVGIAAQHLRDQQGQDRAAAAWRERTGSSRRPPPPPAARPGTASRRSAASTRGALLLERAPRGRRTRPARRLMRRHVRRRIRHGPHRRDARIAVLTHRHGLPRRRRRHLRRRRGQGAHQGPGAGDLQPGGALRDRLLRRDVPARPLPLPASRCWSPPPTAWAPRSRWRSLAGVHDTVGYDLVAHCVNDILVQGAVPLFFLDYIALGRMDPDRVEAIVRGLRARLRRVRLPAASAARRRRCPAPTRPDDYDLAGFIVGVVEREQGAHRRRGARRATCCSACPPPACTRTATRSRARCSSTTLGLPASTPRCPSSGTTVGRGAARARTAATSPPSSRCSSAARSAPSPTSRAAASRATSRASCPRAWARAIRRERLGGAAALPPDPEGRRRRRRRDVPHLQHGRRHGRGRGARATCTTSSTRSSAAARRAS